MKDLRDSPIIRLHPQGIGYFTIEERHTKVQSV